MRPCNLGSLLLFFLVLFSSVSNTQANCWSTLSPSGSPPSERYGASGAWSSEESRLYIFGGSNGPDPDDKLNELHFFDSQANAWQQLFPSGSPPSARWLHTAVWGSSRLYIFAGESINGRVNDLYSYGGQADNTWQLLNATGSAPSPRVQHSAAWNPDGRMYIFGGLEDQTDSRLNDLHYYDTQANSWNLVSPSGSPPAGRRYSHAVWNSDGFMYIYGGVDGSDNYLDDLHYFDSQGNSWHQLSPGGSLPGIQANGGIFWSSAESRMYIFAGVGQNTDMHYYDEGNNSWTAVSPTGTPPSSRYEFVSGWSPEEGRFYVWGGRRDDVTSGWDDLHVYQVNCTTTTTTLTTTATVTTSSTSTTSSFTETTSTTASTSSSLTTTSLTATQTTTSLTSTTTSASATGTTSTSTLTSSSPTTTSSTTITTTTSSTTGTTTTSSTTGTTTTSSATDTTTTSSATGTTTTSSATVTTTTSSAASATTSSATSSTTTASSTASIRMAGSIAEFVAAMELSNARVVSQLTSDAHSTTILTPLGPATAFKLPDVLDTAFVNFSTEQNASIILPAEVVGGNATDFILVLTEVAQGAIPEVEVDGQSREVLASLDASLINRTSLRQQRIDLDDFAIYLRLSSESPGPTWTCAFLDGETWSTEGVRIASIEELTARFGESVDTSGFWCATTHLSIFGILDILLDCTNVNVLSYEGLQQILRPAWWLRWPSLSLWLLFGALLLLILLGMMQDAQTHKSGIWRDEYFLTDLPPISGPSRCARCAQGLLRLGSSHRDNQEGSEHTEPTEAEKASPSLGTVDRGKSQALEALGQRVSALKSLKSGTGQQLKDSVQCQNTLRQAARQHRLHSRTIQAHIWGTNGWIQGSLAVQQSPKLKQLVLDMEDTLPTAFVTVHSSFWHRFWSTLLAVHPVYELLYCDLHITAAKRAKITMDCLLGSLAFVALFFSVDGSAVAARNPSDCPIEQSSLLWIVAISLTAILLNFVPRRLVYAFGSRNFVQASSHRKRQLLLRRAWDLGFWLLGTCLSCFHLLMIMAFLANLGTAHEWKWMASFGLVLLRKLVLVPLLAAIFSFCLDLVGVKTSKAPEKFGLDVEFVDEQGMATPATSSKVWEEKVKELAGRGITIRQLLDFYSRLGQDIMYHFDPDESTTHDVVRQAIIPMSTQTAQAPLGHRGRSFEIVLRLRACSLAALDIWPDLSYEIRVDRMAQAWRRKCQAAHGIISLDRGRPAEVAVVEEVFPDEELTFCVWDFLGNALQSTLPGSSFFWDGFHGDVEMTGSETAVLSVSITSCALNNNMTGQVSQEMDSDKGYAYATIVNHQPCVAVRMVTHSWRNKFTFLLSAILADALQAETYDQVAEVLRSRELNKLAQKLKEAGKLDVPYWVCAFSVNQHAGICGMPPPEDSTKVAITPCRCKTAKHFSGDLSEMNKFDDMMAYLKRFLRQRAQQEHSQVRLAQVVAMDVDFSLLTRVWCVAELVEAKSLHLPQAIKIHSAASRKRCLDQLLHLDVRTAEASFPADKELVLSKINDVDDFNLRLSDLLLHRLEAFLDCKPPNIAANCLDETVLAVATVMF